MTTTAATFDFVCHNCHQTIECPVGHGGEINPCPHCATLTGPNVIAPRLGFDWLGAYKFARPLLVIAGIIFGFGFIFWAVPATVLPGLFLCGSILLIYFIPAALGRHKRNFNAILLLNLFLGWTVLGWIIALVWAATKDPE